MKKLSKTDQPQTRHGDPVPEVAPKREVCRCDIPEPGHQSDRRRYTGEVFRGPRGIVWAWFDCPHGKRWQRRATLAEVA